MVYIKNHECLAFGCLVVGRKLVNNIQYPYMYSDIKQSDITGIGDNYYSHDGCINPKIERPNRL